MGVQPFFQPTSSIVLFLNLLNLIYKVSSYVVIKFSKSKNIFHLKNSVNTSVTQVRYLVGIKCVQIKRLVVHVIWSPCSCET